LKFIYYNYIILNSLNMGESTDTERRAVVVLSRWWEKIKFPTESFDYERCNHCKRGSPWDNCNKRVSKFMIIKYAMTDITGYKCRRHLCICQTNRVYPKESCPGCGCYTCTRCGSGCECIDNY